jgi:pSer/pThr/pTyr-binding forkhead associated (FHA) protein
MPNITLKFKDNVLGRHSIGKGQSLTIGRRKDNDIVIENLAVSGHHAKIDSVADTFVLVDLQSKNGSFVNERLVITHWLKNGDVISIGKHFLVFSTEDDAAAAVAAPAAIDKTMLMDTSNYRSMVQKSAAVLPKALRPKDEGVGYLAYLSGGQGKVDLHNKLIKLGKDPAAEIVVKGLFVGGTAATISRRPDGYYLSYAGGLCKPRVNDQAVKKTVILKDLDVIAIGSVKLQFFIKDAHAPAASRPAAGAPDGESP